MKRFNLLKTISENILSLYHYHTNEYYGKCGTPTQIKDMWGNELFVGDVVSLMSHHINFSFTGVVCKENNTYSIISIGINSLNKDNLSGWNVNKIKAYSIMEPDSKVDILIYK